MASQGRGAKTKGASFERKVAKTITKWWVNGGMKGEFYRTPASGGLRWQERDDTIGDISTPIGFTHTIECKNDESFRHKQFIEIGEYTTSGLYAWWEQACNEAKRANKFPWLIIKKNYCKSLLIFSTKDSVSVNTTRLVPTKIVWSYLPTKTNYGWNDIGIIPLDIFLEVANSKEFVK